MARFGERKNDRVLYPRRPVSYHGLMLSNDAFNQTHVDRRVSISGRFNGREQAAFHFPNLCF